MLVKKRCCITRSCLFVCLVGWLLVGWLVRSLRSLWFLEKSKFDLAQMFGGNFTINSAEVKVKVRGQRLAAVLNSFQS